LLSPLVLKEKVKGGFYFGLLVACIGGVIVASNERCILSESGFSCGVAFGIHQNNSYLGLLLALFGAFAAAGYMLIGRKLSSQIDTLRYTAIVYSVAAITMLFVVILRGEQLFYFTSRVWVLFIAIAIIPQILGHTVLNYSLQSLPATTVSVALLGEPIGSTIFAVIFLQEVPSMLQLIGGFVIMLGIAYSVLISRR